MTVLDFTTAERKVTNHSAVYYAMILTVMMKFYMKWLLIVIIISSEKYLIGYISLSVLNNLDSTLESVHEGSHFSLGIGGVKFVE